MGNCSLCGNENANIKKEINNQMYYFCNECNYNITNIYESKSREWIMKHTNTNQDSNLKAYLDEEVRKGILGKSEPRTTETTKTVDYSEYLKKYGNNAGNHEKNTKKENNIYWTNFLRRIAMINLIFSIIVAIGILIFGSSEDFWMSLGYSVAYVLFSLIFTASIMVFVEMSENTAQNTHNTAEIIEILNKNK